MAVRKLEAALDALFLALFQIISCMVVYFATWMLLRIVTTFVELDYFTVSAIYAVALGLGVGALIAVYGYKMTYRAAYFNLGESILTAVLATVLHLLIAAVFRYMPLLAGAALPFSGILAVGDAYVSAESQSMIPGLLPAAVFVGCMVLYHALEIGLRAFALKRRLRDRFELTGQV